MESTPAAPREASPHGKPSLARSAEEAPSTAPRPARVRRRGRRGEAVFGRGARRARTRRARRSPQCCASRRARTRPAPTTTCVAPTPIIPPRSSGGPPQGRRSRGLPRPRDADAEPRADPHEPSFSLLVSDRPVRSTATRVARAVAANLRTVTTGCWAMDFRILGPLEVDDDGRPVELGGARQRALLAILLHRRNDVVSAGPADRGAVRRARRPDRREVAPGARLASAEGASPEDARAHAAGGYVLEVGPTSSTPTALEALADGRAALRGRRPRRRRDDPRGGARALARRRSPTSRTTTSRRPRSRGSRSSG